MYMYIVYLLLKMKLIYKTFFNPLPSSLPYRSLTHSLLSPLPPSHHLFLSSPPSFPNSLHLSLSPSPSPPPPPSLQPKEEWMERRTLRRDRQDLLDLQLSLQQEVEAKTKIAKDLTDITAQYNEMERYIICTLYIRYTCTVHVYTCIYVYVYCVFKTVLYAHACIQCTFMALWLKYFPLSFSSLFFFSHFFPPPPPSLPLSLFLFLSPSSPLPCSLCVVVWLRLRQRVQG